MPPYYVNVGEIVAILVGGALLMVPVLGLTLRLTVPPIIESVARARSVTAEQPVAATMAYRDALTRMAELAVVEAPGVAERGALDVPALAR